MLTFIILIEKALLSAASENKKLNEFGFLPFGSFRTSNSGHPERKPDFKPALNVYRESSLVLKPNKNTLQDIQCLNLHHAEFTVTFSPRRIGLLSDRAACDSFLVT